MNNGKVAIIIVNWNGLNLLDNCLKAVLNQSYKYFKVFFVDNGSTDESVDYVNKNYPDFKVLRLSENTGFAKGNNVGISEALKDSNVEYIVFLNNDTKVDKDWLLEMIKVAEKDSKIGMIASKAFFPDGKIQSAGLFVESKDFDSPGGISRGFNCDESKFNKEIFVFAPSGCSAFYKRKVIEKIGFFDEDYFAYSEDLDLGWRANLYGWKCLYNPKSKLIHYHSKTAGAGSPMKAFYVKRNSYFTAIKIYPFSKIFDFIFQDCRKNLRYFLKRGKNKSVSNLNQKVGFRGILGIIFKAYWEILINIPRMIGKRSVIQKNKKISKREVLEIFRKYKK